MKIIKQKQFATELGANARDRNFVLDNLAICGNCKFQDLLIGFTVHYDWESNSCSQLKCPKCESRYICEFEENVA